MAGFITINCITINVYVFKFKLNWYLRRLQAACQGVKQELQEAVRATGEPSFAEPLVRFLFNNVDDCAGLGNKNQGEMNQCNQEKMDYCADVGGEFQGEMDQTNTQEGDKRNERPPYAKTENGEYGRLVLIYFDLWCDFWLIYFVITVRLGYRPLEEGGSVIRRISYSNQRKIGLNQN